jgi:hypothetical protein
MARKEYVINGEYFKTKKSLLVRIRSIRDNAPDFQKLNQDDFDFMFDLLRLHKSAEQKIGCGAEYMYVRPHPEYYNSRGFWVVRTDGTHANFSFLQCLNTRSKMQNFKKVCRLLIDPSILQFKRDIFEKYRGAPQCPVTGKVMTFVGGSEVHHAGENTFDKILTDFVRVNKIDIEKVQFVHSNVRRITLADQVLARKFVEFHENRAQLQVVSKDAHLELTRGRNVK